MAKALFIIACILSFSIPFASNVNSAALNKSPSPELFMAEVSDLYLASMYFVFQNQQLINQPGVDKSSLFGQSFIKGLRQAYEAKFNKKYNNRNSRLHTALLTAMIDVMEENRTLILDDDISFKGLIPATYAFQLSEKLSRKGIGVKIKFTNTKNTVRNQLNLPDPWETETMKKFQQLNVRSYFDEKSTLNNVPSYRYFVPLKLERFCLDCHGATKQNPLNAGIAKSHWSNIDVTGFEMENWKMGDFGGGMSMTIYKKDFLELEELCELKYISAFSCHFFALE
jgi:hypothetical protein